MTTDALDNARDALEDALDAEVYQGPKVRAVFAALRAVLAEHERLTAPPRPQDIPGNARAARKRAAIVIDTGERTIGAKIRTVQTTPPTDDELDIYHPALIAGQLRFGGDAARAGAFAVGAQWAAGFRRQGPVTEAEILAGLNAELLPAHRAPDLSFYAQANIDRMRAVLEAARGVIA